MLQAYRDIISRLGQPKWWDEVGCPRYDDFKPRDCNCIYAREAALIEIACQACGRPFSVAMAWSVTNDVRDHLYKVPPRTLADQIKKQTLHYGDPPMHKGCATGATMNCDDLRVLEYWTHKELEWRRDATFEIALRAPWEEETDG